MHQFVKARPSSAKLAKRLMMPTHQSSRADRDKADFGAPDE